MKTPSNKEKIIIYESYLHLLQLYVEMGATDSIGKLLRNACDWSYAHRFGNGELSENEQKELINKKFNNLLKL
jgi:hypothetical protein